MRPLISVIVPVYNVEQYLRQCIESILKQSYREIEVLLINDGSTDSSGIICQEFVGYDNVAILKRRMEVFQMREIMA